MAQDVLKKRLYFGLQDVKWKGGMTSAMLRTARHLKIRTHLKINFAAKKRDLCQWRGNEAKDDEGVAQSYGEEAFASLTQPMARRPLLQPKLILRWVLNRSGGTPP